MCIIYAFSINIYIYVIFVNFFVDEFIYYAIIILVQFGNTQTVVLGTVKFTTGGRLGKICQALQLKKMRL